MEADNTLSRLESLAQDTNVDWDKTTIELGTVPEVTLALAKGQVYAGDYFFTVSKTKPNEAEDIIATHSLLDKVMFVTGDPAKWSGDYRALDNRNVGLLVVNKTDDYNKVVNFWLPFLRDSSVIYFTDFESAKLFIHELRYKSYVTGWAEADGSAWVTL